MGEKNKENWEIFVKKKKKKRFQKWRKGERKKRNDGEGGEGGTICFSTLCIKVRTYQENVQRMKFLKYLAYHKQ